MQKRKFINVDLIKKNKGAWILSALLVLSFLLSFSVYLFGNHFFLFTDAGSDCMQQFYPTYINIINMIRRNKSISLWNMNWGMGIDLLARQDWVTDPFAVLIVIAGLVFGNTIVLPLLIWTQFIKVVLSGMFAYAYLRCFDLSNKARILGAYLYGFNSFLILWGQHYYFGAISVYLIIILWIFEKRLQIHESNKNTFVWGLFFSLALGMMLWYSVYLGYMVLMMLSVYAIMRFLYLPIEFEWKLFGKRILDFVIFVLLGLLLGSVMILPFIDINVIASSRIETSSVWTRLYGYLFAPFDNDNFIRTLNRLISNNTMGTNSLGGSYYELPQLALSVLGIPLIFQGIYFLIKKGQNRNRRISILVSILLVLFFIFNPLGSCIFNGFQYPFGRYTFVYMPIFTVLLAIGLNSVFQQEKMNPWILCGTSIGEIILIIYTINHFQCEEKAVILDTVFIISMIVSMACYLMIYYGKKMGMQYILIFAIIFLNILDTYTTSSDRETWTKQHNYFENDTTAETRYLQQLDTNMYRIEKSYWDYVTWGDSLMESYPSTVGYCSNLNKYLIPFYMKVWPEATGGGNNVSVTHSGDYVSHLPEYDNVFELLGVKYILTRESVSALESTYTPSSVNDNLLRYQSNNITSVISVFDQTVTEQQFEELSQADRNRSLSQYLILNDKTDDAYLVSQIVVEPDGGKFDNNYTLIRKSDSSMYGNLNVDKNGYLFVSIPYREGWTFYIDGKKAEKVRADYGFMAVPIQCGEHVIEIKYENKAYFYGALLSAVGVIIWIIGVIYCRRSKEKIED